MEILSDDALMAMTLRLAGDNVREGGLPYAAVIARAGMVVAQGVNEAHKSFDPSAHAEMNAIRQAGAKLGTADLSGCKIFVVGQPCAMCLAALMIAKIWDVVFAVNTKIKDEILTKMPPTCALYDAVGHDFGADDMVYHHMPQFSEQGEAVFRAWNDG